MKDIDPRYVLPICHYFCCCCPRTCQTCINCGIAPEDRDDAIFMEQNSAGPPNSIEMTNSAFTPSASKETVVTKAENEEEEYDYLEGF